MIAHRAELYLNSYLAAVYASVTFGIPCHWGMVSQQSLTVKYGLFRGGMMKVQSELRQTVISYVIFHSIPPCVGVTWSLLSLLYALDAPEKAESDHGIMTSERVITLVNDAEGNKYNA